MNSIDIKDRVIGSIQRDRLAGFLKESANQESGCFYNALIMAWEELNPHKVLPREIEQRLLNLDKLGVYPSRVIEAVKAQEDLLHVVVSKVTVTNFVDCPLELVRQDLNIPLEIPIAKLGEKFIRDENASTIIAWYNELDEKNHATTLFVSSRFQEEGVLSSAGDDETSNLLFNSGYRPLCVYQLRNK